MGSDSSLELEASLELAVGDDDIDDADDGAADDIELLVLAIELVKLEVLFALDETLDPALETEEDDITIGVDDIVELFEVEFILDDEMLLIELILEATELIDDETRLDELLLVDVVFWMDDVVPESLPPPPPPPHAVKTAKLIAADEKRIIENNLGSCIKGPMRKSEYAGPASE